LSNWWAELNHLAAPPQISPALQRAHHLLKDWLSRADKLPVHDLLDHIYFSADVHHRYAAALPEAMRATVQANLQALLEVALDVDGGRYPSLLGFLAELRELRAAENESPDEGKVGEVGNALRIYTVHGQGTGSAHRVAAGWQRHARQERRLRAAGLAHQRRAASISRCMPPCSAGKKRQPCLKPRSSMRGAEA
jgi:hypothetical protein